MRLEQFKVLLFTMLLAASSTCNADKLRLLAAENIEPYVCKTSENQYWGIDVKIIDEILRSINIQYEVIEIPRTRASLTLKSKKADGYLSTLAFEELETEEVWYSSPLYDASFSLIVLPKTPHQEEDFHSTELLLGTVRGGAYSSSPPPDVYVHSNKALLSMLKKKRLDGVLAEEISFFYSVNEEKTTDKVMISQTLMARPIRFAVRKDSVHFNKIKLEFNDTLDSLKKNNFIDKVFIEFLLERGLSPKNTKEINGVPFHERCASRTLIGATNPVG
mgnify:CR=1 FL=1